MHAGSCGQHSGLVKLCLSPWGQELRCLGEVSQKIAYHELWKTPPLALRVAQLCKLASLVVCVIRANVSSFKLERIARLRFLSGVRCCDRGLRSLAATKVLKI